MTTPPDAKAELLPCPFCGSTAFVDGSYDICCDSCGATSHVHDTEADAIAAWSSRVYPSDFSGWPRPKPPIASHTFNGNAPGVVGADNCQICGRWFDEPETDTCRNFPAPPVSEGG